MCRYHAGLVFVLVVGCTGGQNTLDLSVDAGRQESVGAEVAMEVLLAEQVSVDSAADALIFPEVDALGAEGLPEGGGMGYPCETGAQCLSGVCLNGPGGRVCTINCVEECPVGWVCAVFEPLLPDTVYVCAPLHEDLCRPCSINADCRTNGVDVGAGCVSHGDAGSFCGGACEVDSDCPDGFLCKEVVDQSGKSTSQCILSEGECLCRPLFIDEGALTACRRSNQAGSCAGTRKCEAGGLSECSAAEPQPEQCNQVDDDCDGQVDEGTGGDACKSENEFGFCPGTTLCQAGKLACDAKEAAPEICDGIDNDCDGSKDEGYPDTDADEMADCLETDKDADGAPDGSDNCAAVANPGQEDFDLDSLGDACDLDDDDDKSADPQDCASLDPKIHPGAQEECNGVDDNCNFEVDEGFPDGDGDLVPDCLDGDDDGDLTADDQDCGPDNPAVHPGAAEVCDGIDNDCDAGTDEGFDDTDVDGIADCVDADLDGDGVPNGMDNCPSLTNVGQANQDGDGLGDACDDDRDGDGVPNGMDNCSSIFNPGQSDLDSDGEGDACEGDLDGDGIPDAADNCPLEPNPDQVDTDADGAGDACDPDVDGDGDPDVTDCADTDPSISHAAEESCDGLDNDCDGVVDDGHPDFDLDGLRDCVDSDDDNDADPDGLDCAPFDPKVNGFAAESCNGVDDNCDGKVDDGLGTIACGQGACKHIVAVCEAGAAGVCNPFQGAQPETCDGIDNDCDGSTDEGMADLDKDGQPDCADLDDDGDSVPDKADNCPTVPNGDQADLDADGAGDICDADVDGDGDPDVTDCADADPAIFHAAEESCDGVDNDCDGVVDDGHPDFDLDGLRDCVDSDDDNDADPDGLDCAPFDPKVNGFAVESCNGVDDNCDGEVDDGFGTIACGQGACTHVVANCEAGKAGVCNPFQGALPETCDGIDNDCDGSADEGMADLDKDGQPDCTDLDDDGDGVPDKSDNCATVPNGNQADLDKDGLGNSCDSDDDGDSDPDTVDCSPLVAAVHHGAIETCNQVDDDCDGLVDEGAATGCKSYYADVDEDNYGTGGAKCLCVAEYPYLALTAGDCSPLDPAVNPGKAEVCDGKDNNCGGGVDEGFPDLDKDTLADCVDADDDGDGVIDGSDNCPGVKNADQANLDKDGLGDACDSDKDGDGSPAQVDCNDLDATLFPGNAEKLDGIDNNCNNQIDEGLSAVNCKAWLQQIPGAASGLYPIDPDGPQGPLSVQTFQCDMTTEGGGWTILYSSSDAAKWGTGFGVPGQGQWGHDLHGKPISMSEVILIWPGGGQSKVVSGIPYAGLYACQQGSNGLWWDGSLASAWAALHLGVCDTVSLSKTPGYVITCATCNNDHHSWGMGHRGWIDDQQGWGWDSLTLGPTVFSVGVR